MAIYVKLSTLARQEIRKELDRSRADISQGHETGGWLFAEKDTPWWRTEGITIEYASGPSDKAVRGPGAIDMDTDALFSAADVLLEKHGLEVVGAWHIHPGGDDQPSDTDIERVAALLSFRSEWGCRTQCGLEMILTPKRGDWAIHPWVFMRSKTRGIVLPAGSTVLAEPAIMRAAA